MTASRLLLLIFLLSSWTQVKAEDFHKARLRVHYESGLRSYNLGDYRAALAEFKTGYLESGDPVFLYNLAQCWRMAGEWHMAEHFYRAFLRESHDLDARRREEVTRLLSLMEHAIYERRAAQPPSGTIPPKEEQPIKLIPLPAMTTTTRPASVEVFTTAPEARHSSLRRKVAGWSVAGSGLLLAVVGAALVGITSSTSPASADTLGAAFDLHHDSIDMQAGGGVLLGVGALAVVSGAITLGVRR